MKVVFVELRSTNGPISVATEIDLDDGRRYTAPPQQVIREWISASRKEAFYTFLLTVVLLIALPALFVPGMRERMWTQRPKG